MAQVRKEIRRVSWKGHVLQLPDLACYCRIYKHPGHKASRIKEDRQERQREELLLLSRLQVSQA
jgi:hypothetical protein